MSRAQVALLTLVLFMLGISVGIWAARSNLGTAAKSVDAAPLLRLELPDANGTPQAMRQWQGKVIVANFWATWCPPCRDEIPAFQRLSRKYEANGVQFVGISIDSPDKVRQFAAEFGVTYPLLIASSEVMSIATELGNRSQGLPFTVILDREGAVRRTKLGRLSEESLESALRELM